MHESSGSAESNASRADTFHGPVLVAGGTGFIGSAVVRGLAGHRAVAVLTRNGAGALSRSRELFGEQSVEIREGDLRRPESLPKSLTGVDTVVQCVQFPGFPVEAPALGRTFLEVDAKGTETLVAAARRAGVRKFVYVSGIGADPDAEKVWFRAKARAEQAVSESGLDFAVVRPSWTYGPGDSSLNRFVGMIRHIPFVFPQLGPGTQRINPVFIEDVASLLLRCITSSRADGRVIEIGGREILTIDQIIGITMRAMGREKAIVHIPLSLGRFGGRLLERFPGQLLSAAAVDFVTQSAVADLQELDHLFPGFQLIELPEAVASYLSRDGRHTR